MDVIIAVTSYERHGVSNPRQSDRLLYNLFKHNNREKNLSSK